MLDMGFIPDIERICKLVPFTRQTLFFSATMPPEIARLTNTFLSNPARVEVSKPASTATNITQLLVPTGADPKQKREVLRRLIREAENLQNGIIFCNRKTEVANLHRSLVKHGFPAVALHGDMDQHARLKALDAFRNGEMKLLVASDVAARGLDIPEVSHVFNFDVPHHAEDYVHRIGRTGRAGRAGSSLTLVAPADKKSLGAIEKLIGQSIPWAAKPEVESAAAEMKSADRPAHARNEGRGKRRRGGRGREAPQGGHHAAKESQRSSRPPAVKTEAGEPSSHLPAFLLRPVPQKVS
jgi:superfamily II DNA/RNA helicase